MFTDGLVHDIDYFIDQFSPIEVTQQTFPEEKGKGLFYFTGNLKIDKNTEQIEYYYYSDDNFTQTYDHETLPVVRDGISTVNVKEYYARSESKTVVPGSSEWSTVPPEFTGKNKYLWNYEVSILSDGKKIPTAPAVISENGKGIKAITEYYAVNNSATISPESWSITPQTVSTENKYLWNYEVVTYDDDSTTQTAPAIIGTYGEKGEQGPQGEPGPQGQPGQPGVPGAPAPKYLGPFNNSNIPTATVTGDTYLNLDAKKMFTWRNNDWNVLSDQDSAWWAAMGDAINYANTSGQNVEAANIWVGKLVAGTILADTIMSKALIFKNTFQSENWNGGANYLAGTQGIYMDHNGNAAFMGNVKLGENAEIGGEIKQGVSYTALCDLSFIWDSDHIVIRHCSIPSNKFSIIRLAEGRYKVTLNRAWVQNESPCRKLFSYIGKHTVYSSRVFLDVRNIFCSDMGHWDNTHNELFSEVKYQLNVHAISSLTGSNYEYFGFYWSDGNFNDGMLGFSSEYTTDISFVLVFTDYNNDSYIDPKGGFSGIINLYAHYE